MSFAIPVQQLSTQQITEYVKKAKRAALQRAMKLGIASSMDELVFREASPATDLGAPAGTGYTNETYITGAAVINTWTSVFLTAAVPTISQRAILVFYKITDEDPAPACAGVRFRLGPTGATTLGWFPIEQFINVSWTPEVWLSEPVVYGPSERPFIEFYPRAAVAVGERLGFGCFVAEPAGEAVS